MLRSRSVVAMKRISIPWFLLGLQMMMVCQHANVCAGFSIGENGRAARGSFRSIRGPNTPPLPIRIIGNPGTTRSLASTPLSLSLDNETGEFVSLTLGDISRTRIPSGNEGDHHDAGDKGDQSHSSDSFQASCSKYSTIPSFQARGGGVKQLKSASHTEMKFRGLEGALDHGPAFVLDGILSKDACQDLISTFETIGFGDNKVAADKVDSHQATQSTGTGHKCAQLQILVSEDTAKEISQQLARYIDVEGVDERRTELERVCRINDDVEEEDVRLVFAGLDRKWQVIKYECADYGTSNAILQRDVDTSSAHESKESWSTSAQGRASDCNTDGNRISSRLTVIFYLNDDFTGGTSTFYQPMGTDTNNKSNPSCLMASVHPKAGSCLVFPQPTGGEAARVHSHEQWPQYNEMPIQAGSRSPKYIIQADILFATERDQIPSDNPLMRYDHLVRKTFRPQSSPVWSSNFLQHLESLYNPHMGAENLGAFLYSFVRFTKKRRIVEIGSGYTSPWILQALQDNDDELARIRKLQKDGKCSMMNWPWAVPSVVDNYDDVSASLLCVDNCLHEKETATGAVAVAEFLGTSKYMEFMVGDAFDMQLQAETIDILWCDFGVGSRMKDFCQSSWPSIKEGGYLLCHSTLTNVNTRTWLEAIRCQSPKEETGIPVGEYVEVSLLEPHKHYQNSITVIQKRKGYTEPLYSEYA